MFAADWSFSGLPSLLDHLHRFSGRVGLVDAVLIVDGAVDHVVDLGLRGVVDGSADHPADLRPGGRRKQGGARERADGEEDDTRFHEWLRVV